MRRADQVVEATSEEEAGRRSATELTAVVEGCPRRRAARARRHIEANARRVKG
ncbi:MAG: hypothetical protein H6983_03065 [Ectothiorhodospiraceae bacterium]|nr:hypothetical protein [Ectothiorhodospiraceae bacterium]